MRLRRLPLLHLAGERLRDAHKALDAAMAARVATVERERGETSPCRTGCAHCCRQPVFVGSLELVPIVQALRDLPRVTRQQVLERLRSWFDAMARLSTFPTGAPGSGKPYLRAGITCPLLSPDETCLVYEVRPIACRTHQVIGSDPAECGNPDAMLWFVQAQDIAYRAFDECGGWGEGEVGLLPDLLYSCWPWPAEPGPRALSDAHALLPEDEASS